MVNNEQKQDKNGYSSIEEFLSDPNFSDNNTSKLNMQNVLNNKQESKLTFGKFFLVSFLLIMSFIGSFLAGCGGMIFIKDTYSMYKNTTITTFIILFILILFFMRFKLKLGFKNIFIIISTIFLIALIIYYYIIILNQIR